MKYLNKTIEYGLYLLVFLLPLQTRWMIRVGELKGEYFEYGTFSLYATDVLLILVLVLFLVREIASSREHALLAMTKKEIARPDDAHQNDFPLGQFGLTGVEPIVEQAAPISVDRWFHNNKIIWFIGGLLIISAISAFFAFNQILALYKLGWLILSTGLFWLVIKVRYNRLKLIYAILAGMFLQAVLGSWQFLTQASFSNKWLGLALHRGADLGTSVIEAVGLDGVGERWLRAYGGLDHPNILGGMLAIGILLLVREIIFSNNFQINAKTKIIKIISWIFLAVFTMALFFSFSRAAWLGLFIGLVIIMIRVIAEKNLKQQKILAEIILVMGIILFVMFSQYQNLVVSRLGAEGRLEKISTSERLVSYQESWQIIKNNWATGVGLGNYTLALNRQVPEQNSFYYQPTHSVYLLILCEIGVVGFIFFILILLSLLMTNFQFPMTNKISNDKFKITNKFINFKLGFGHCDLDIGQNKKGTDVMINLSVIIILVVMMTFDHWLFSLHFGILFFWLVLGIIARKEINENEAEN